MVTRERFERQPYSRRLGSIAANLERIASFSRRTENEPAVATLIQESRHFIEWSASSADEATLFHLASCQRVLTRWSRYFATMWRDEPRRAEIAETAHEWADVLLQDSGLLEEPVAVVPEPGTIARNQESEI